MKKTKLLYIVIAILAVSQIYSLSQISHLNDRVQQTENSITYTEERLGRDIGEIYANVDRKLTEYTSLVASCGYEIGAFNPQTYQVPITFKLQPKTLTQTTTVFLKFGEEKLPMERQNTQFVLTKNFALKDDAIPTIIIEDKGTQQFEEQADLQVYGIKDHVFSSLSPRFSGERGYNAQVPYNYHMKGHIETSASINSDNNFKDIKYIVTIDNEVIKTYEADFVGAGNIEIDDTFKMETGQTLTGKVVAVDELNFTHEYLIMHYVAGKGDSEELDSEGPDYGSEKITAPDGTVIFDFLTYTGDLFE